MRGLTRDVGDVLPRALATIGACCALLLFAGPAAAAIWVSGEVPDWDQPYTYPLPNDGPGPNPGPGADPFDAWCAATAASNLLGHWEDVHAIPVADGLLFSAGGGGMWPAGATWHDWNLGTPRPAPGPTPGAAIADLGWFMDSNNSGSTLRGNVATGHVGTFVKDIHEGLAELIVQAAGLNSGVGSWTTGTRGATFALGLDSAGAAALPHVSAGSAFAEIQGEINAGRTILVAWAHWNIAPGGSLAPIPPATDESQFGGDYYTFTAGPPPPDPWGNDESWEEPADPKLTLGHVTTAVGYIPAGDPDDPNAPGNPTDWVIVHDNAPGTARNVIVPLTSSEYTGGVWVANVNANRQASLPLLEDRARDVLVVALVALALAALVWRRRPA